MYKAKIQTHSKLGESQRRTKTDFYQFFKSVNIFHEKKYKTV